MSGTMVGTMVGIPDHHFLVHLKSILLVFQDCSNSYLDSWATKHRYRRIFCSSQGKAPK